MKIAVVGAGAMGSLFGGLLAEAGNEVWLYDLWAEHVAAINQAGLDIEREGTVRTIKVRAVTDPARIGRAELVIVFVKSTQTAAAAETARDLAGEDGLVLTLQNGMGNADIIAATVAAERVVAGTTAHGATLLAPGKIRHAGLGPTIIGMWTPAPSAPDQAQQLADFLTAAGIATEAVTDVHSVIWNKLLINIGINAVTALTGIKNGQILDLEVTRNLCRAAVEEAMAVARALQIDIAPDAVQRVFKVAEATAANRSSMGQDVDHRRPTEISTINGFIVDQARQLGLDAPVNETLTALIETLQYHY